MTISLIIPFYEKALECLHAVNTLAASAGEPIQVLVQDDASPSCNLFGLLPPGIVERNPVNAGFAGNCNQGAKRAQGEFLVFCNQDVVAVPGWSDGWAAHLRNAFYDPSVGIVAPRLLFENLAVQSVGGLFDARCQPYHRCLGYSNPNAPEVNTPRDVSWATGAWLAVRREIFEKVGGFDTSYRMYWEDVEFCGQVALLGYRIHYTPALTFIHRGGSTGGSQHFQASARLFKERWVNTGKIVPDTSGVYERFW